MRANLSSLRTALTEAIAGMTSEQLLRHPEGKWCASEILEHLNLTYIGTVKNLERCLAKGQRLASPDRSSKRWQRLAVTRLHLYPGRRESPERARPRGLPPDQVKTEIFANLAQMEKIIDDCEARFGCTEALADHPILGPLTVREWRGFHLAHGRHHLKQIVRLKNC